MDIASPYKRSYKTKSEEYEEKIKRRNETQEWIFGNKFGKPGGGAPLRDSQGNIISSLKSITNNNIYKYNAKDFSKGDNFISTLNSNYNVLPNQLVSNNRYQNLYDNSDTQNNMNNSPYILQMSNINNINNINNYSMPYLIINPTINLNNSNNINNNFSLLNNSQKNNQGKIYTNNSYNSFIDLDLNKKDLLKKYENERYRKDLLNQIEDNKQRISNKKREIEEQNRIDEIKNQEYYLFKQKQEEEYERKKKLKI